MRLRWIAIAWLSAGVAVAQNGSAWSVRPEWVRAHEEFLASDAMGGRGSATHDEEITATYVASEFIGYGLKPAPGMTGYIQAAAVTAPVLDGHGRLSIGSVRLDEGTDFYLLQSPGAGASGAVSLVSDPKAPPAKGAAIVVPSFPAGTSAQRLMQQLGRASPALIVLPDDDSARQLFSRLGGRTRTPIALADTPGRLRQVNVVIVKAAGLEKLKGVADGATATLEVHVVPPPTPRQTYNAIGYLEGSDPDSGTILLTAHLDHLGIGNPMNGDAIYNGANDDAAGTTAVLELAHALAAGPKLKRSILFVCYGSEEVGELGSTYFGEHPPVPLKDMVTNLEFEMIGNQDPKMPKGVLLLTGWDRSNLGPTLKAHGALLGPDPYPEEHFFERSDNYALALKGVVAHTAAGWGTSPTYHQPSDDMAHLDIPFMTAAIQSLVEPVRWLASSDFRPQWNTGGRPSR